MLLELPYDRQRAVEYAQKWALDRNPLFLDFTGRAEIARILFLNVFSLDAEL